MAGLVAAGFLLVGCSKKADVEKPLSPEESAQLSQEVPPPHPQPSVQGQPQPVKVAQDDPKEALKQLNRELLKWVMRTHQKPTSFEGFVGSANIQVPPPPPGMKYELNKEMRIVLVRH